MEATENLLIFGWTRSPASLILIPWTRTWCMIVALISLEMMALVLPPPSPPPPPPPSLPPPPLLPSIVKITHAIWIWHGFISWLLIRCNTLLIWNRCVQFWVLVCYRWQQCVACVSLLGAVLCHSQLKCTTMLHVLCEWQCVYSFAQRVIPIC